VKGVILAAGKGTRMLPLTERRPKPLVPVLDKPMLEHIVTGARDAGVDEIALIIGHLGEQIQAHFGDGSRLGMRIEYIWQMEARGTGHAALLAEEFVAGEPFFMSWGDIIVPPHNYKNVVGAFTPGETDAVLSLNWVEDPYEGAAVYEENGFVVKIEEKPPKGTATTNYNNAGLFVYEAELFDRLKRLKPSPRGELELPDAVQEMVQEGKRIAAVKLEGYWSDVARPVAVLRLNDMMIEERYGSDCGVYVDPAAEVSESTVLRPPVYIGPGCRADAAVVGPSAALMADCNVADGAKVMRTAMFTGSSVGENATVRRCVVEEGGHISAGETVVGESEAPLIVGSDGTIQEVPE